MNRPEHSPLGASGAERWMHCPGSIALLKLLGIEEQSDDPSYRKEGTAMHACAEYCLTNEKDAWEVIGQEFGGQGVIIDQPMAMAVQTYIDYVLPIMADAVNYYVEYGISSPIHELFYGKLDFGAEHIDYVDIVDLKGGQGIIVEPERNPQMMYYAFGLIEEHPQWPDEMKVNLTIAQPRAPFHPEGVIRTWPTTVGFIRQWVKDTLLPAMVNAEIDGTLDAGPWCRFCPAKLICPMLTGLFKAAATANPDHIVNLNDKVLGLNWQQIQAVKFYIKALEEAALARALNGHNLGEQVILVDKKANRVWKPSALDKLEPEFGDKAFTQPALKGPAAIEALGPKGAQFVKRNAFTPQKGYTLALADGKKVGVKVELASQVFKDAIANLEKEQ